MHAGSFLRKRQIVVDSELLASPREAGRILIHELYHFVWLGLGNNARKSYEALVAAEIRAGAKGELGWSSEWRKDALAGQDLRARSRRWRDYSCESFCDTAAWMCLGGRHEEFTLPEAQRKRRRAWFLRAGALKAISL